MRARHFQLGTLSYALLSSGCCGSLWAVSHAPTPANHCLFVPASLPGKLSLNVITAVFDVLESGTPFGLVPIENSLHGAVIETLDRLRCISAGRTIHMRGEYVFRISHSLLARRGIALTEIRSVYSHEQVGR